MILQLKTGRIMPSYFRKKFDVDILDEWADVWRDYQTQGFMNANREADEITLTRDGLMRADALLSAFFEPEHRDVRYT